VVTRRYDVAIIGGGAVGSSIAYFLLNDPSFQGTVAVIERDPAYKRASSALSASAIRQQFSTRENIRMSQFGIGFLREINRYLGVDDGALVDIGLTEGGYLYLASPSNEAIMRENHEIQREEGADVALLGPDELVVRFPWLNVDGVVLGSLGLSAEGWFDGYGLMRAFRRKAQALGAAYLAGEAVGLDLAEHLLRVDSVRLADGGELTSGTVVNAAGPWARQLAAMAGVPLPVEARRRAVFVFDARWQPPDFPLVIDTSGAWFRPEGEGFIAGHAPPESEDLPDLPLEVDRRQFDDILWPALAERVPKFEAIKVTNAWAGYYEVNTFDHNAILGPHPEIANFFFANGFSGHGLMQSPAVGRAISELVVHGRYVTLDLSVFGYERITAGRPVVEKNVIG
jgi:FAD-dependent oxidoreductase domain-containing protein 1